MKWNGNPFVIDGGAGGQGEDDGAAFLLPTGWAGITNSSWVIVGDQGLAGLVLPGKRLVTPARDLFFHTRI